MSRRGEMACAFARVLADERRQPRTLLDGRPSRRELDTVLADELEVVLRQNRCLSGSKLAASGVELERTRTRARGSCEPRRSASREVR